VRRDALQDDRLDRRQLRPPPERHEQPEAVARTLEVQRSTLRVFLRIDNLLDRNTIGSVIVNESNGRYFEPAPPRTWLAGLDIRV